ncbi:hypothetical protein HYH03_015252 [Edaphochlamys debaryana]|uniref:HicB-like antitoxin of toxin-antitoxin system domain-containing protein n=1 Tax=Edaphochlamys debaryana TaxID=47281 RepID=A0A835XM98_9CHLO|nr:hypothetical protein HYH03_015252 [Edaphochlamys debaryana]|eukprot:KAG2486045.1 hypothetical protein HYH03_015252 [Edaphochlamys debaryana]
MSQDLRSLGSSLDNISGTAYPVYLRRHSDGLVSAIFPQFSFGIGAGMTEYEALEDAKYILVIGLDSLVEDSEEIPSPLTMEAAQELMREWSLNDVGVEVSWAEVEVEPECLAEGQ